MSRRERQVRELRALCERGPVSRAVDLAFEHFADFGRNDEVLDLIAAAIARTPVPAAVRRRFVDLQSPRRLTGEVSPGQRQVSGRAQGHPIATNDRTTKGTPHVQ